MADFVRKPKKFTLKGMSLARPVDLLPEGVYALLQNLRSYTEDVIEPRPGLALKFDVDAGASDAVHSVKRLNDPTTGTNSYIVGAGTKLYNATAASPAVETGLSGKPLSIITHRPDGSQRPWAYVADANKMRKTRVGLSSAYGWGIAPPNTPPSVALSSLNYKTIDAMESVASWSAGGTGAGLALVAGRRVDTTITHILYDSGSTGWACVSPAALTASLQAGMLLAVNPGGGTAETVYVCEVLPAVSSTTVSSIVYDSGASGLCTIQLAAPSALLKRDSMLRLAAAENVRVLSVTEGPGGVTSFRCSTAATRSAGNAVAGLACFRAYFANSHAAAEALQAEAFEFTVAAGIGFVDSTQALDLSVVNSRPVTGDDEVVISLQVDDPGKLTELKVLLDCDGATNDFTHNWYEYAVLPSDLTPVAQNTLTSLTVQQRVIQREEVRRASDYYGGFRPRYYEDGGERFPDYYQEEIPGAPDLPSPDQFAPGNQAWTTLRIPVKSFKRFGTDSSRGWANVAKLRVQANATASITVRCDSWLVAGTRNLGTGAQKFNWRYRYRNHETGVYSLPSPPLREMVEVTRGSAVLTPAASSDAQVDRIVWERFSEVLNDWYELGSQPNSGTFTDEYADDYVKDNPKLRTDCFQPFPKLDVPRSGTCDVTGTEVTRVSGDAFNTSLLPGTDIKIGGVPYTLYGQPSSPSRLSLNENAGTLSGATWEISEGILLGQPVDVAFGPYGGGETGVVIFSVDRNAVVWTVPNSPDWAPDANRLEITSPSEPLLNGCIYDGRPYVWSSERMFELFLFGSSFVAREVANSKGLYGRWALTVGDLIYFVAEDGLYSSEGGEPKKISGDLDPVFPHNGVAGRATNGVVPPDYASPDSFRLSFEYGRLYFDFVDTAGDHRTLVFRGQACESYDIYTPGVRLHYAEEGSEAQDVLLGSSDGKLYKFSGSVDDGAGVAVRVKTAADDFGDPRSKKRMAEVWLDADGQSLAGTMTATPYYDSYTSSEAGYSSVPGASRFSDLTDLGAGEGTLARNIALDISFTTESGKAPRLYGYEFVYLPKPEDLQKRYTDWQDAGHAGAKLFQGVRLKVDTRDEGGAARTRAVQVRYLNESGVDTLGATLSVSHDGERVKDYPFATPFNAYEVRLVPADDWTWRYFSHEFQFEAAPDLAALTPDFSDAGALGAKRVTGFVLEADTAGSPVNFVVQRDGSASAVQTVSVNHAGRVAAPYELTPFVAETLRLVPSAGCRVYEVRWLYEEYPELATLTPDFTDAGVPGAKRVTGVIVEADTAGSPVSFTVQKDGSSATVQTVSVNHAGRAESVFELTPFFASTLRLVPAADCRVFRATWLFEKAPEQAALVPDFDALGTLERKRVYGVTVEADTAGVAVNFVVQKDGSGSAVQTIPINHSGRIPETFELTPFLCHTARIVPAADARLYDVRWHFEPYPEQAAFLLDYSNLGTLSDKYVRAVKIEGDTGGLDVSVAVQADGSTVQTLTVNHNGKLTKTYPLTPFAAREVRLSPAAGWTPFSGEWVYDLYPALARVVTPWTDAGREGPKLLQGVRLKADTANAEVPVQVQYDGGAVGATLSCRHDGQVTKNYGFTPFVGSNFRLVPQGDIRVWEDAVEWVWEPVPAAVANWTTPETSLGFEDFFALREGEVAFAGGSDVTLTVTIDGTAYEYTLAHDSGSYAKRRVVFRPVKGKRVKFALTSPSAFRLYRQDAIVRACPWAGDCQALRPFGDDSLQAGARI